MQILYTPKFELKIPSSPLQRRWQLKGEELSRWAVIMNCWQ